MISVPLNRVLVIAICIFLISCASNKMRAGSEAWHAERLAEIEEAYKSKQIDDAEYLKLKNEADAIRADHQRRRSNTQTHFGFGSGGGSVGIGVGF